MKLLFVCSGNTCRSPLAVAAWQAVAPEIEAELNETQAAAFRQIVPESAGLGAMDGAPAAPYSVKIASDWDVDLSGHRARHLTPRLMRESGLIVVMTADQAAVLRQHFDIDSGRLRLLGSYATLLTPERSRFSSLEPSSHAFMETETDILDPYGGSFEAYESCASQIRQCVATLSRLLAGTQAESQER